MRKKETTCKQVAANYVKAEQAPCQVHGEVERASGHLTFFIQSTHHSLQRLALELSAAAGIVEARKKVSKPSMKT